MLCRSFQDLYPLPSHYPTGIKLQSEEQDSRLRHGSRLSEKALQVLSRLHVFSSAFSDRREPCLNLESCSSLCSLIPVGIYLYPLPSHYPTGIKLQSEEQDSRLRHGSRLSEKPWLLAFMVSNFKTDYSGVYM
jgi:ribosomal protein S16